MEEAHIKKTIYFVRHAQSVGNVSRVFIQDASPLTKEGAKQAKKIAVLVSRLKFDAIISSPLVRAKQTAQEIAVCSRKDIEFSDLFIERREPSVIAGKTFDNRDAAKLRKKWGESFYTPRAKRILDGETFDDIRDRSRKALEFLQKKRERNIIVVTHCFFLHTIIATILFDTFLDQKRLKGFQDHVFVDYTGLSALILVSTKAGDVWKLRIYNEHILSTDLSPLR